MEYQHDKVKKHSTNNFPIKMHLQVQQRRNRTNKKKNRINGMQAQSNHGRFINKRTINGDSEDSLNVLLSPPNHFGCKALQMCHMDPFSMSMYMPLNVYVCANSSNSDQKSNYSANSRISNESPPKPSNSTNNDKDNINNKIKSISTTRNRSVSDSAALVNLASKMNILPGCEPGSTAAEELKQKHPYFSTVDIVRFLVARKGSVQLADEMIVKEREWHRQYFPVRRDDVRAAIESRCFFPFGRARDGSPVVFMRGGLYDNTIATPQQYVIAAAHTIEYSLKQCPDQVNVTVIVHSSAVPGAPNATGADMNFIKLFIQVLSDNYPERLRKLVIFPFPWYGRAIWGVVKVFVDKRTQDKILLLSSSGSGIPAELSEIVDPKDIPECCGGFSKEPIMDLMDTLTDETECSHLEESSLTEDAKEKICDVVGHETISNATIS